MELYVIGIPIAIFLPLIARLIFPHKVTLKEYLMVSGINIVVLLFVSMAMNISSTYDTEVWSGEVTEKYSKRVSCEHSYDCNCRDERTGTDSKGNPTYSRVCDTCYEHAYDVNWVVRSNVGYEIISRVDRRGLKEPPRYSKVQIGEPYATTYGFKNYILASPDTLFVNSMSLVENYKGIMPAYPSIFDYYRINRVIGIDKAVDPDLNIMLNDQMRKWGPTKQANIIVVVVSEKYTQEFYEALQAHWKGGKKNDVVIVVQVDQSNKVGWTRVFSRADQGVFDKSVEYDVNNMGTFDSRKFVDIVNQNVKERFHRVNFEKFKYLLDDYRPSYKAIFIGLIFALLINIGLNIFIVKQDVFGDENRR
jgi:hypothetical protein